MERTSARCLPLLAALVATPALADDAAIPRPEDGWAIQGTTYRVLVDNLTGLVADAPDVQQGMTKTCNFRFAMQPGRLTQVAIGKCLGGLEEPVTSFLQGMFFWPLEEGTEIPDANGAGINVVRRGTPGGTTLRIEAEPATPFLEQRDGEWVPFTVWQQASPSKAIVPEPSKKAAKVVGGQTCTMLVEVDPTGLVTGVQALACPPEGEKAAVKAIEKTVFNPQTVDGDGRASSTIVTLTFTAP